LVLGCIVARTIPFHKLRHFPAKNKKQTGASLSKFHPGTAAAD